MIWSPQQERALTMVGAWIKGGWRDQQVFRLFGFAGSGKSTLAMHLAQDSDNPLFGAFTGKAASVMRAKGCPGATTIHRMIYTPTGVVRSQKMIDARAALKALHAEHPPDEDMPAEAAREGAALAAIIKAEEKESNQPSFEVKEDSPAKWADLIVIDECFVGGTLVDTPIGGRPISSLTVGDVVYSAAGVDTVIGIKRRKETTIAKVVAGGKACFCSTGHPFFTERGIKSAAELEPGDNLLRTAEAMRLLRRGIHPEGGAISQILQSEMSRKMDHILPGDKGKDVYKRTRRCFRFRKEEVAPLWASASIGTDRAHSPFESNVGSIGKEEDQRSPSEDGPQAQGSRWQWPRVDSSTTRTPGYPGQWLGTRVHCVNGATDKRWPSNSFQGGHCQSRKDGVYRGGRNFSLCRESAGCRPEKGHVPSAERVDSVTLLEQGDLELDQFRDANGVLYLYDIEVERHPSFSVNGWLVHNCSMVSARLGEDLMSFGKPILVLGDPAQLPPVKGCGFFTEQKPDVLLTEIHRQGADSPIIRMATDVCEGRGLRIGSYGDGCDVIPKADVAAKNPMSFDQILVGKNATRRTTNVRCRELLKRLLPVPEVGDRLVCLRNDHDAGLLNGEIHHVTGTHPWGGEISPAPLPLTIKNESSGDEQEVLAHAHYFLGLEEELGMWERRSAQEFDYGYALTCHKAQGSQFDSVLVFDESYCFRQDAARWLYTAVTRAAKRLTVVKL